MKILRVLTRPNLGGPTRQAVALWHAHRAAGVETLLAVGACRAGEGEVHLDGAGLPQRSWDEVVSGGRESAGWVRVPHLRAAPRPGSDLRAGWALGRLVRAFRPDVVHTHTSKAGFLGRRAARRAGVPVVAHTFHGHVLRGYFGPWTSRWLRRVERRLAARTDVLVAVSPSCAEELAALGIAPRQRLQVVPPAVELARFATVSREDARRRAELGGGTAIAWVGRLVDVKRPDLFAALVAAMPGVQGHLFGTGPLAAGLRQRAPANLHLHGGAPDLHEVLAGFDALVVTSEREGCPLVALEAQAAGVPVVGFDVPGVRDALAGWGRGVLVPRSGGVDGLARALVSLPARRPPPDPTDLIDRCAPERVGRTLLEAYAAAR